MSGSSGTGIYRVLDDERINGRADFFAGLDTGIDEAWSPGIATLIQSDSEVEDYRWLGTSPMMQEWLGEAQGQQLPNYAAYLRNVQYEATLQIQKKDIDRDKTGQIRARIAGLGQKAGRHWDKLGTDLLSNSETAGGANDGDLKDISGRAFDNQAFFDTDHSYTGSNYTSNQSNDLSSGVWDVATATAPTPDEMAKCILEAVGTIHSFRDDQGDPINAGVRNFTIVAGTVPIQSAALQAVGLENLSSGASNPLLALGNKNITFNIVLEPRLSAKTTKLYVLGTGGDINPFIYQEEDAVSVEEEDPSIASKHIIAMAKASRAAGYGLWQKAVLGTFS